ncbi:MAG: methyltransferase domain-containing protein [Pseudomonadota bacterium]
MDQEKMWEVLQNEENFTDNFSEARQRYMVSRLTKGSSVLNIGVGSGALERLGSDRGITMHSLDPSETAIERLRKELDMKERAQTGYAQSMPFADGSFDAVVISEVIEHLEPTIMHASFDEIKRVLRSGGVVVISTPFNEKLSDGKVVCPGCGKQFHRMGHVQSFDKSRLADILKQHRFTNAKIKITTFVDWKRSGIINFVKSTLRLALAKMGQQIAVPHLFAVATKPKL